MLKYTRGPTKTPRPTPKPIHRITKSPTICMPAEAVKTDLFAKSINAAAKQQKTTELQTTYNFKTYAYKPGLYQRGTVYISFNSDVVESRCLAVLISNATITFPAACMFNNQGVISQEWYNSFVFQAGFDAVYGNLQLNIN